MDRWIFYFLRTLSRDRKDLRLESRAINSRYWSFVDTKLRYVSGNVSEDRICLYV